MPIPSQEELSLLEQEHKNDREGRLFVHLADAYMRNGDLERAKAVLEQGLEESGESPKARLILGQVLIASAKKVWAEVLQQEPENESALRSLAELEFASGRRTEALKYYRSLIRIDPGDNAVRARINSLSATDEKRTPDPSKERLRRPSAHAPPPREQAAAEAVLTEPIFKQPAGDDQADSEAPRSRRGLATIAPTTTGRVDIVDISDALVRIIESRDGVTRAESSLTRQLARAIGEELDLDEPQLEVLSLSALLCRLGSQVGSQLDSRASSEAPRGERESSRAVELLQGMGVPATVLETVRHQYERWDGGGLPGGLREEDIPFMARVLAVSRSCAERITGAFDGRPRTASEALAELQTEAGSSYDPVFVSLLRRAFRRRAEHGMGFGFGGRVLVIHREELRSLRFAALLQQRGYLPEVVADTARARSSLRERPAIAILMGASIPHLDLIRFIRDLRASPALSGTPVLVLDANDLDLRVELLEVGADICFPTEADPREMTGALDALLRRREVEPSEVN